MDSPRDDKPVQPPRFVTRWVTPLTALLALCALVQPDDTLDDIVVAVGAVSGWLL